MKKVKSVLVIDVESTCWEDKMTSDTRGERNEIIEIGIAVIENRAITETRSIITLPPTCQISEFCTQLTTLDAEYVDETGISFENAIRILKQDYKVGNSIFASWGDYDRKAIDKNCRWNGVSNPMSNMHLNVKALYAAHFGETGGMDQAAKNMNIPFEGTHHRGVDDAKMIAKILLGLL